MQPCFEVHRFNERLKFAKSRACRKSLTPRHVACDASSESLLYSAARRIPASPSRSSESKLDDQPSSRTTSLQPTMGVGCPFRRIDLCHPKRDLAGLDLLPEPIELLKFLRVRAHKGCREVDIPLRDALESADGREGAAVTNGGDDTLIEHRSVREPINSLREVSAKSATRHHRPFERRYRRQATQPAFRLSRKHRR